MRARRRIRVTKNRVPVVIAITVACCCVFSLVLRLYSLFESNPVVVDDVADAEVPLIETDTSIAFYTIAGASQKNLGVDWRGKFWEFQLKRFTGNYSLQYLSDGPLTVNGVKFMVLPEGSGSFQDSQFCIRTPETWKHFMEHNLDKKWYFRGTHDTFINMTALTEVIADLERKGDPMTTYQCAFNMHEFGHVYYPHGGTGWLFSNYAVRRFYEKVDVFVSMCKGSADDVALTSFFSYMGLDVMDYQTNRFIVTFPLFDLEVISHKRYSRVKTCPPAYYLYPNANPPLVPGSIRNAACLHMHKVPMDQVWGLLSETPPEFAVYFPNPNLPQFCNLTGM